MIEDVTMESSTFMPAPERFEAGSQPIAQIVGWSAALQYLSGIGMARIAEHERILTSYMLEGISGIDGVRVLGPGADKERIGVVAFAVEGVHLGFAGHRGASWSSLCDPIAPLLRSSFFDASIRWTDNNS